MATRERHDFLTRTNPGYFQERDISVCLLRAFNPESIMINRLRKDTSKEILDHLVLTDSVAIVKELFNDEGDVYATACGKLAWLRGGGLVMDYNSFHAFTLTSVDAFINALDALHE